MVLEVFDNTADSYIDDLIIFSKLGKHLRGMIEIKARDGHGLREGLMMPVASRVQTSSLNLSLNAGAVLACRVQIWGAACSPVIMGCATPSTLPTLVQTTSLNYPLAVCFVTQSTQAWITPFYWSFPHHLGPHLHLI